MRRFTAIILLSVLLLTQTELHELLKLPALIEHYFEHKAENRSITLLTFLSLHYFNGDIKDNDYARDMQLPFKGHDCMQINAFSLAIIPQALIPLQVQNFNATGEQATFLFYKSWLLPAHTADIWQPPRIS